jgi:hypothetical protein
MIWIIQNIREMRLKTFLIILSILLLVTCEKDLGVKTWTFCNETQCSNAWDDISAINTEDRVKKYLENKDIRIFDIKIETYSYGPFCAACFCPSGRIIQVLVQESDLEKIQELGFKK